MLLLVGLGNPGPQYAGNRHNIGFMAVDAIIRRHSFSPPREKFTAFVSEGRFGSLRVTVLKPLTFMNRSGQAVGEAMRFFKLTPADIIIFHDDLDLGPGKVRVKQGGGHGGHNGLRSLDAHIGKDYWRVRLGIGHPGHRDRVTSHVLGDFAKADADWLGRMLDAMADAAPTLADVIDGKGNSFTNALATRYRPPEISEASASDQTTTD
ncbi:MAG: aminoacyl-tRNA hydrolase [Sphingomonadales bacterium]